MFFGSDHRIRRAVFLLGGMMSLGILVQIPFLVLSKKQNVTRTMGISAVKKPAALDLGDYLRAPRLPVDQKLLTPIEQAQLMMDQGCLDFLTAVSQLDLTLFNQPETITGLPRATECNTLPESLAQFKSRYDSECAALETAIQTVDRQLDASSCRLATISLRAAIQSWRKPVSDIAEAENLSELTDALVTALFTDTPRAQALAEKLTTINSQAYSRIKKMTDDVASGSLNASEALQNILN